MTISTLYALFGSDLRHWFTNKEADVYFFSLLIIAFALFSSELLLQSCVKDDYKYSFFFWLDFIATFSLILDIPWLIDIFNNMLNLPLTSQSNDVIPGSSASKKNSTAISIIKSFRLVRLIRIIKLYNYAMKSNAGAKEARLIE
jgi:hypothetical protein